jgi:hypothetical protein
MARVAGVIASSRRPRSRVKPPGARSTNCGRTASKSSAFEEATKLNGVVSAASPSARPRARTIRCSAAVPLLVATARAVPQCAAIFSSNASISGPNASWPERSVWSTRFSAFAERSGWARGREESDMYALLSPLAERVSFPRAGFPFPERGEKRCRTVGAGGLGWFVDGGGRKCF